MQDERRAAVFSLEAFAKVLPFEIARVSVLKLRVDPIGIHSNQIKGICFNHGEMH